MASAIIHICVAKEINKILKMDEKELYLGTISPDISKQIGESKNKSHFLNNKENDVPDIYTFLNKYKDTLNKPFNMGYFIHLYTDKIWFAEFMKNKYYNNCIKLIDGSIVNISEAEKINIIYNDYTNLNVYLLDEYNLDLSLFYEEMKIPDTNIDEIPIDKLPILIDKMGLIVMNSTKDKAYVFDESTINEFINYCANKILRKIEEYHINYIN